MSLGSLQINMATCSASTGMLLILFIACFYTTCLAETSCADDGWFGPDCQYQCHCAASAVCDKVDGSCGSTGCDDDWFGPACQYRQIKLQASYSFQSAIDNRDTTCYPSSWKTTDTVTVTLATPIPLTWIRVVFSKKGQLKDVTIKYHETNYGGAMACPENRRATVDEKTVDIYCSTTSKAVKVTVTGSGVKALCSLHISGGRNVALKQQAKQSSRYTARGKPDSYKAEYAVDGRTVPASSAASVIQYTCTHTTSSNDPDWWTVTFSHAANVIWFQIYNRDTLRERLKGFTLTASPGGSISGEPFTYQDRLNSAEAIYTVVPDTKINYPVSEVRIELHGRSKMLTLCEVFVYGDSNCTDSHYGLACERECNCLDKTESCFVHSGGCPSGCAVGFDGEDCSKCADGWYGQDCEKTCSANCAMDNNPCVRNDGTCSFGCDPGYTGGTCESECPAGTFGHKCQQSCSNHCAGIGDACNHINGTCDAGCDPGFYGERCTSHCSMNCAGTNHPCDRISGDCDRCDQGSYGPTCQHSCSSTCAGTKHACDRNSGHCESCMPGYYGDTCSLDCSTHCVRTDNACDRSTGNCEEGCTAGFYGLTCTQQCRKTCGGSDNVCDRNSGKCHSCDLGYYGDECEKKCPTNCIGSDNVCDRVTGDCDGGCDPGFYGSTCEEHCSTSCAGLLNNCSQDTGVCDSCNPGSYGDICQQNCSVHCARLDNTCEQATGACDEGCRPGYEKQKCDQKCAAGFYGGECRETCSKHCAKDQTLCNHVTGVCDQGCRPGYYDAQCKAECLPTTWGQDCANNCSTTCVDSQCHHVNGQCVCKPGLWGDACDQICNATTFGVGCAQNCGTNCLNQLCHHVTGICGGCADGWTGDLCVQQKQQNGDGDNSIVPIIVGIFVAVVVICAVVAAFLLWRYRRNANYGKREAENGTSFNQETGKVQYANMQPNLDTPKCSKAVPTSSADPNDGYEDMTEEDSDDESSSRVHILSGNTAVPVETLRTYILQHSADSHFKDQFSSVPMASNSPKTCGLLPQNIKKNRYKNIIPYDDSRVLLQVDQQKDNSDYINASYIRGNENTKAVIASQGPNDLILHDFVRMLWEQKVGRVVMLTNLVELGKKKCTIYWPADGEEEFGEISLKLLTTHVFAEYTIRHMRLSKSRESPRDLTQFHFTAWPDKSVPDSPWGLVDLYQRVMSIPDSGTLLVHCSAGVGRTGTFIALCNLLEEANTTGKMDFLSTLWKLRQDRMHTIQNLAQYIFLHKVALVGHVVCGTTVQVKDMYAKLASLEGEKGGDKSTRSYKQEFEDVEKVCNATTTLSNEMSEQQEESVYQNTSGVVNKAKNRLSNILPNKAFRPVLTAEAHKEDTYINAVLVPNLNKDSQDILTQLPMPATVTDFWRLVTQYNVGLVVAFDTDSKHVDETIGSFLPKSEKEPFENDRYRVETRPATGSYLAKEFSLTIHQKIIPGMDSTAKPGKRTLTFLQCKKIDQDPDTVLQLHEKINSCRPSGKSRIIYMCCNGADQSGLMCVQSILLDRLEVDQCLTVPLVVGTIKAIREQVIPTVDQYKCLYQVLKLAHESQNVYGNMGS